MARHEADREDILREATALVERAELAVPGYDDHVVIGFRRDGSASIYIGADPVYQFNSHSELRRLYLNGRLIKADHGRLVGLDRQRGEGEVQLLRHEFTGVETASCLANLQQHLSQLRRTFQRDEITLIGQAPLDSPVITRIRLWLDSLPAAICIARAPNAR
jgi:hypothetical protein